MKDKHSPTLRFPPAYIVTYSFHQNKLYWFFFKNVNSSSNLNFQTVKWSINLYDHIWYKETQLIQSYIEFLVLENVFLGATFCQLVVKLKVSKYYFVYSYMTSTSREKIIPKDLFRRLQIKLIKPLKKDYFKNSLQEQSALKYPVDFTS